MFASAMCKSFWPTRENVKPKCWRIYSKNCPLKTFKILNSSLGHINGLRGPQMNPRSDLQQRSYGTKIGVESGFPPESLGAATQIPEMATG